jgi:hypothetical protein
MWGQSLKHRFLVEESNDLNKTYHDFLKTKWGDFIVTGCINSNNEHCELERFNLLAQMNAA